MIRAASIDTHFHPWLVDACECERSKEWRLILEAISIP